MSFINVILLRNKYRLVFIIFHKLSLRICLFFRHVFNTHSVSISYILVLSTQGSVNATPWQNWLEKTNVVVVVLLYFCICWTQLLYGMNTNKVYYCQLRECHGQKFSLVKFQVMLFPQRIPVVLIYINICVRIYFSICIHLNFLIS